MIVIAGEWFGLFERVTERVPFPIGAALVLVAGFPVFRNVIRAALRRQVISHTLMSVGVIAALVVGQWATAAVVVFFMRVGDYAEGFTSDRSRRALKDLTSLAPQTARVERDGAEAVVPIASVRLGETVVVRPGDLIPTDGEVVAGQATIDQAAITGESLPVEIGPGAHVFAATTARLGSLRVRVTGVGADTTFGRVIKLVEEAESHRADVQRIADRFSGYFLPVVGTIAAAMAGRGAAVHPLLVGAHLRSGSRSPRASVAIVAMPPDGMVGTHGWRIYARSPNCMSAWAAREPVNIWRGRDGDTPGGVLSTALLRCSDRADRVPC